MLTPKPLEVSDFSGGITENYLQADPRRYEKADNFLIGVARDLVERDGFIPFSANGYKLPAGGRVNTAMSILNDTELVLGSGRYLFAENKFEKSWYQIPGVAGNFPLSSGDDKAQVTWSEFQSQTYFTSDSIAKPAKFFRDKNNQWVAMTAGLPRANVKAKYTEQSLLQKCILVANELRASMIAHIKDATQATFNPDGTGSSSVVPGVLHFNPDRYTLCYFEAVTFLPGEPAPAVIPTPAPVATDEASLLALVGALNSAYGHHMGDASNPQGGMSGNFGLYHYDIFMDLNIELENGRRPYRGPFPTLNNTSTPLEVEVAADQLDDLLQKWNWHRLGVYVHGGPHDYVSFNKYQTLQSKIEFKGFEKTSPLITPDMSDVINYVNNLKYLYNYHINGNKIASVETHKRVNGAFQDYTFDLECTLPDATTLDEAFLMIYWLRALYGMHNQDSATSTFVPVQFTRTNGSPNLTAVIRTDTGAAYTLPMGSFLWDRGNTIFEDIGGTYTVARVILSGSGTATLDRKVLSGTSAGIQGQITYSAYHSAFNAAGTAFIVTINSIAKTTSFLANPYKTVGADIDSWLSLAADFFTAFSAHALTAELHVSGGQSFANYQYNTPFGLVPYPSFYQPTVAQYSYAFYFSHEYKVGQNGVDFLVQGNPVYSDSASAAISYPVGYIFPNQNYVQDGVKPPNWPFANLATRGNLITGLPVLTNTPETNYDLENIKLNIYRTLDGGTTWYKLAEVPNGTTTYTDYANDTISGSGEVVLETQQKLYTTGGVLGYDQPPESKYLHQLDGFTYFGAFEDAGQFFAGRILQSAANNPDAAPAANYLDLDDELRGISSTRSVLIGLCKSSIFRVTGGFSSNGSGSLVGERIADSKGCINTKSIVQTEIGVFFAGTDGFYYTDGFQIIKVSIDMNLTYAALTKDESQQRSIYGTYDPIGRRIWWAMKERPDDLDNSIIYVFHLDYGTKPSGAFTLQKGENFQPSSLVFQRDQLYMGHGLGAVLKSDHDTKFDWVPDTSLPLEEWGWAHIPYWYRSAAIDVGTAGARKWLTKLHVVGQNTGNVFLVPNVIRDLNQTQAGPKAMAPIAYRHNLLWGDPKCLWGNAEAKWNYDGKLDAWRRFPASTLRSDFVQVEMKPSFSCVYSSSQNYPEFTGMTRIGASAVCTLVMPDGYTELLWPLDCVGMELRTEAQDYEVSFPILEISADQKQIIVDNSSNRLIGRSTGLAFEIWGYAKNQRVNLVTYVLHYAYIGDKNQAYPGAKSSAGPGNGGQN